MAKYKTINNNGIDALGNTVTTSSGVVDADKIPSLNAAGKFDSSLFDSSVGEDIIYVVCSENLSAGDFVNFWNDSDTPKVRKADAGNGRNGTGFVDAAYTSGDNCKVFTQGTNVNLSGLTTGTNYFLSTTAGQVSATAPDMNTTGNIIQILGVAISATAITFNSTNYTVIA